MERTKRNGVTRLRFDSVTDLVDTVERDHMATLRDLVTENGEDFCGGTPEQIIALAREGWDEQLERTLEVADTAVSKVERDQEVFTFQPVFDVSGGDVDVARFLSGEPENMVDYPLQPIVKAGRVITLCVSIGARAMVSRQSFIKRGQAAAALALALGRLGYSVEVWADVTASIHGANRAPTAQVRTLVKGATDPVDAGRIMYALAHPSMHRGLGFAVRQALCPVRGASRIGYSVKTIEDLPEGTIYTPALTGSEDVPDAAEQLIAWLRELEIVTD